MTLGSEEQHTSAVIGSLGHLSLLHSGKDPGRTDVTGTSGRVWLACFWPGLAICGKENVVQFPPKATFLPSGDSHPRGFLPSGYMGSLPSTLTTITEVEQELRRASTG